MIQGPRKWVYIGAGVLILILGAWMLFSPSESAYEDAEVAEVVAAGNKGNVKKLEEFAKSSRVEVASAALVQLVRVQGKGAKGAIEAALADSRPEVKATAARQMGKVGDPNDPKLLIALLSDPNPAIREAACGGLGKLYALNTLEPLVVMVEKENDTSVQEAGVAAIQSILGVQFKYTASSDAGTRRRQLAHVRAQAAELRKNRGNIPR